MDPHPPQHGTAGAPCPTHAPARAATACDQRPCRITGTAARTAARTRRRGGSRQPEPADDLAAIDGIGPKIAKVLREAGYATFDSVAASNEADLRRTLADAGLRLAPTLATWPAQAAELAALRGGNRRPSDP
ncbi:MAG: hypothetical protein IPG46_07180 [Actinobacteria bacterium]|nr:hypothetical protein [Actinomycetota bacterium]